MKRKLGRPHEAGDDSCGIDVERSGNANDLATASHDCGDCCDLHRHRIPDAVRTVARLDYALVFQTIVPAPLTRADAHLLGERTREVALIGKAAGDGDIRER